MAKKPKPADQGHNGVSESDLREVIDRYFELSDQVASIMGAAMAQAKGCRTDQKDLLQEFHDRGGNRKAMKARLREIELERKHEAIRESLADADQDDLDAIKQKLGDLSDTPLGTAAIDRAAAAH